MLEILPLQTKDEILSACEAVGTVYNDSALVYAALLDGEPIALCQFKIKDVNGEIISLSSKNENSSDVLVLLARSTLSFMELCGSERVFFPADTQDQEIITAIEFTKDDGGRLFIDFKQ